MPNFNHFIIKLYFILFYYVDTIIGTYNVLFLKLYINLNQFTNINFNTYRDSINSKKCFLLRRLSNIVCIDFFSGNL